MKGSTVVGMGMKSMGGAGKGSTKPNMMKGGKKPKGTTKPNTGVYHATRGRKGL